MPRRLYPCTPSRLRSWLDCPRRYRMTYLDRPAPQKGPPWAHNSLGASVHNALAGWWRLKREERTPEAAGGLLAGGWITEGYADDAQSADYLRRSRIMVERYAARLDPACEPAGVERTVAAKTDLIAVSGRIDRLDDRPVSSAGPDQADDPFGRELVVVDYKTGRGRLSTVSWSSSIRSSPRLCRRGVAYASGLRGDGLQAGNDLLRRDRRHAGARRSAGTWR